MMTSKPVFVPVADALNNDGKGVWLGRNRVGWVFLDRTLSFNQPSDSEYLYVRASDWTTYWNDVASSWKGEWAYVYYAKYLSDIPGDARATGVATVEALCVEYLLRAPVLRHEMQQLINSRRRKKEESLAIASAEREEEGRISLEQARAAAEKANKLRQEKRIERLKSMMLEAQQRDSLGIKTFIRERGVRYLYHFTRTANLDGIAAHGVLPRAEIPEGFPWNDAYRFDGFPEATCLSAGFINYKMFWYCHYQNPDVSNWALVAISPEILTDMPCLFFSTNAANGRFRHLGDEGLASGSHMGLKGLCGMYFDEPKGLRSERGLKAHWTTDPQAEILAFGRIPASRIAAVVLLRQNLQLEQSLRSLQPRWRVGAAPELFEKRDDYKHWQASEAVRVPEDTTFLDDIPL